MARQLRGRLRRRPVHGPQAPRHPLRRPYGGGAPGRCRAAHRTPLARRGVAAPAAALARRRRRGDRPPPAGTASGGWTGCCRRAPNWSRPTRWWAAIRDTLAGWCGETPPYELLDTGVHTVHHRLARRWRVRRAFLAGDAAHLLGALGTQGLDEGLRDVAEPRLEAGRRLAPRAPARPSWTAIRRNGGRRSPRGCARPTSRCRSCAVARGCAAWIPGTTRGHDALVTDGHLGRGPLGAPPAYPHSPLAPPSAESHDPRSARRRARRSPTYGSRPPTARPRRCGTGSAGAGSWWSWSRRAPASGTAATGSRPGSCPAWPRR